MFSRPFILLRIAVPIFCLAVSRPVCAREKSDILVMNNGDRLTCEVKRLVAGVLEVDLAYVDGSLSIDWRKVARLESKALFLIQMQDGSRYWGKIITAEALPGTPVKLEIQSEETGELVVNGSEVVQMTQYSERFFKRFSGSMTAGAVYSKGNNATQYSIGSELSYPQTRWGARLSYNSNLSSSSGAETATRNQVDFRAYRMLPWKHYFVAGTAGFLQSSVQDIGRQTILGATAGRYLKDTNRVRFSLIAGVGWQSTNYVPTSGESRRQDIAVGIFGSSLQLFTFKKTRLNFDGFVMPAFGQGGRTFSRINSAYYLKLFGKIDWNLSVYGNWDTKPPAHLPSSDYGTSTGLSWTFGNN
jgi:hypothetical protein